MTVRLLVGTYARNGGAGLRALHPADDGGWTLGDVCAVAQNASFGTYSAGHRLHYFVDEQDEGALGALRDTGDKWEQAARVRTQGAAPCYVALNRDENLLAVANYGSGSIALFLLDERTGTPLEPPAVRQNAGGGPVPERQEGPHAHCACFSPDQRWLFHVDLGTDEVLAHAVVQSGAAALGEAAVAYHAPAGSGPRHLVFHPTLPLALLVCELANTLIVLQVDQGRLIERQTVSTLPSGFTGKSLAGHLSIDEAATRVYVTNRGHDSLAAFAWDEVGVLRLLQHMPSGGASPRSFVLLEGERQLIVANEEGGNIAVLKVQPDGTLSRPHAEIAVPGAAFLLVDRQ